MPKDAADLPICRMFVKEEFTTANEHNYRGVGAGALAAGFVASLREWAKQIHTGTWYQNVFLRPTCGSGEVVRPGKFRFLCFGVLPAVLCSSKLATQR